MSYLVYHIKSTRVIKYFDEKSGAKRSVTCANRNAGSVEYAYADSYDYETNVVKMVERTNIMTGKKFMEPSNTPHFCSPSSETYWSM